MELWKTTSMYLSKKSLLPRKWLAKYISAHCSNVIPYTCAGSTLPSIIQNATQLSLCIFFSCLSKPCQKMAISSWTNSAWPIDGVGRLHCSIADLIDELGVSCIAGISLRVCQIPQHKFRPQWRWPDGASTMADLPPPGITGGVCLKSLQHAKTRQPQGALFPVMSHRW